VSPARPASPAYIAVNKPPGLASAAKGEGVARLRAEAGSGQAIVAKEGAFQALGRRRRPPREPGEASRVSSLATHSTRPSRP
jgi:hypothetical protein